MKIRLLPALICAAILCALLVRASGGEKMRALIVDGQNNHAVWPKSTIMLKEYLEQTGLFTVTVRRTATVWTSEREKAWLPLANAGEKIASSKPETDPSFSPDFEKYDLVVSNFGWQAAPWPEATKRKFETYMKNGGGLVLIHAADNSWGDWDEFNQMIGLGGWGGRSEKTGPYVYINEKGAIVKDPHPGHCGAHGPQSEFLITMRDKNHPITKDLPSFWMHGADECYSLLRGPAKNLTILATGCDTPDLQKQGRHEPVLMTITYGKGRVFHSTLGHDTPAFECLGFITTFKRGAEWAATGKVTQEIPANFPDAKKSAAHPFPDRTKPTEGK